MNKNQLVLVERIIDSKGRILLPKQVLDSLNWGPGDKVTFAIEKGKVIITRRV